MTDARRRAGLLVPLFAFPSSTSWGVGDIGDIAPMTKWLAGAGQHVLQLLPVNEMAPGQQSPYSARSAMAIDPIYLRVPDIPEVSAPGDGAGLDTDGRELLQHVRQAPGIDYAAVGRLKRPMLQSAFARFYDLDLTRDGPRAQLFRTFIAAQGWWLDEYTLFRAIQDREGARPWTEWPASLRDRDPAALDAARRALSREIAFHGYLQWLGDTQWQAARAAAAANGVALFGDLPFMVDTDSADVWARQQQFRLDTSVGAPPDAFSATGQDWGVPLNNWDAMAADDFRWLRARARRSAALYDGFRVDHLVGFYRTYGRPRDGGPPFFSPSDEPDQIRLGETVLRVFAEPGSEIIAEDLGTVPDFVRASLARLGVPGYRVLRWERQWHTPGQPFLDPLEYPGVSVAASGTHDTEPLVTWWERAPIDERRMVADLPAVQRLAGGAGLADLPYDPVVRDTLLEALLSSGSYLVLNPIQDVFGWADRINEPATVTETNWTFRLPWPCDRLHEVPLARERQMKLREWTDRHGRLSE